VKEEEREEVGEMGGVGEVGEEWGWWPRRVEQNIVTPLSSTSSVSHKQNKVASAEIKKCRATSSDPGTRHPPEAKAQTA
jgi:hypothetical protein